MPSPDIQVKGSDLRKLTKDLRKHADGKRLVKELRQELRKVAKPFVPAVRKAIGAIPSKGYNAAHGRVSLRRRMQKATKLQAKTGGKDAGVVVRVEHSAMPAGMRNLPAYMEGEPGYTDWRHPSWGRTGPGDWKDQASHPFFYQAVRPAEGQAVRAGQDVVERIAREVGS